MPVQTKEKIASKDIRIKGAKVHNLKNVTVDIPRNKFVVITGLSGSGKSSLAFDTLYAEGQRRYVESLSSYARQFLGKLDKPEVDQIVNISPAITIEQKVISRNSRSTVGTTTEIYDYLKLLYARIGITYSPISGKEVKKHTTSDVVDAVNKLEIGTRFMVLAPITLNDTSLKDLSKTLQQQGFSRVKINGDILTVDELAKYDNNNSSNIAIVVDRAVVNTDDEDAQSRLSDSIQTAFYEGHGECIIEFFDAKRQANQLTFSNKFELDGMTFEQPSTHFFSFNNPVGACKVCNGFGEVIGIDPELVIPNKNLSIYEDAVVCWKGEKMQEWKHELINASSQFDFPIHRPIKELSKAEYNLLWTGNTHFGGINAFFKFVEENSYKIQYRVMLSRYRGKTLCPDCEGTRLRKDASYVKINHKSISELVKLPVNELLPFFETLELSEHDFTIAKRLLTEITNRLGYLCDVGLGYLTLNRLSNTLSGGESQRINLSTSLGSSLVGSMYILDEPSIGLHPRDTQRLITVIQSLKKLGNTVIVVEHDEEIMQAADHIIDMGPEAGRLGGEVVFEGTHDDLKHANSLTAQYLNNELTIEVPQQRRPWRNAIELVGAAENNLQHVSTKIPLNCFTVVTGVSGSGKTSLIKQVFYPAIKRHLGEPAGKIGKHDYIDGDLDSVVAVELVDQNPIGKSSRSNPVTYVKAFDEIRNLMSDMPLAVQQGLKASSFSFNVPGGRCDKCEGEGEITVEMQFIADVHLTCDACNGKRFKQEVLDVTFDQLSIADILELTIDDAIAFFGKHPKNNNCKKIVKKLLPLQEVGLGYVQLGQSSSTLSGGEAQRIKLASFLSKGKSDGKTLFIFDEPTTGLHFHDIQKLLTAFNALIEQGNTVLVIEHHTDMIKCADWVIDLGPDGGKHGGAIVFEGTPEGLVKCQESLTGQYLKGKL